MDDCAVRKAGYLVSSSRGGIVSQTPAIEVIDSIIADPKSWWNSSEHGPPTSIDKFFSYLISYYCDPSSARRAIRIFNGIDRLGDTAFVSWNEVRVSKLADIRSALEEAGCKGPTWELAITIRDFLQNMFDTLGYCDLDSEMDGKDLSSYLDQLQGKPDSWEKGVPTPFRPAHSSWLRKKARFVTERILPESSLHYLHFLLGVSGSIPLDYHSEKVLSRLGLLDNRDPNTKRATYNRLLGVDKPVSKHRKLVEFGKLVCLETKPRCGICPLKLKCSFFSKNMLPSTNARDD